VAEGQSVDVDENIETVITLVSSDANSDPLTYTIVSPPTHGTFTNESGADFTYQPDANYDGSDSFTFLANDGTADSETAEVFITVNSTNDLPLATEGNVTA
jgi:hypothetical protein